MTLKIFINTIAKPHVENLTVVKNSGAETGGSSPLPFYQEEQEGQYCPTKLTTRKSTTYWSDKKHSKDKVLYFVNQKSHFLEIKRKKKCLLI